MKYKAGDRVVVNSSYSETYGYDSTFHGKAGTVEYLSPTSLWPVRVKIDGTSRILMLMESEVDPEPKSMGDLIEFIEKIERSMFRTNQDIGANANALMVWNCLREFAGLTKLTHDDLRQRHIDSTPGLTMQEILDFEKWYENYRRTGKV